MTGLDHPGIVRDMEALLKDIFYGQGDIPFAANEETALPFLSLGLPVLYGDPYMNQPWVLVRYFGQKLQVATFEVDYEGFLFGVRLKIEVNHE